MQKNINLHCAHHPNQKAHEDDKIIALWFLNTIDIKTWNSRSKLKKKLIRWHWRKNWLDDTEEKIEQEQNFKASKTRTIKKTKMKNKHKGFKDRKKKE
jgi:hypothetical protein